MDKSFIEFFAGIGLLRLALSTSGWVHRFSTDYSERKRLQYLNHFEDTQRESYVCEDIFELDGEAIPESFLIHASFPCTDVSSAGSRSGSFDGKESSAIDSFLRVIAEMRNRKPPVILLENVKGLITSSKGKDLRFLVNRINSLGYSVDLLTIDARHFVPQSRERVFLVCIDLSYRFIKTLLNRDEGDIGSLSPSSYRSSLAVEFIKNNTDLVWSLVKMPDLPSRKSSISDIINSTQSWWDHGRTEYLISQMFTRHKDWLKQNKEGAHIRYATAFRRMRLRDGKNQSTAELRLDGLAGCLRTIKGGSAKQILVSSGRGGIKARFLSPSECKALMGASDFKFLPSSSDSEVLSCLGDAVCVDVISWIDKHYLSPFYNAISSSMESRNLSVLASDIQEKSLSERKLNIILKSRWEDWRYWLQKNLKCKQSLYSALVVCDLVSSEFLGAKTIHELDGMNCHELFAKRNIRGHTPHRVKKILSEMGKKNLTTKVDRNIAFSNNTNKLSIQVLKLIGEISKCAPRSEYSQAIKKVSSDMKIDIVEQIEILHAGEVSSEETL